MVSNSVHLDIMSSEKNPTRERILKSTWTLLERGGANAVRMSDIAKAAKISRQALYLHFPNRAELLVATTRYLDEVYDVDARLEPSRTATSGSARLVAWVDAWCTYIPLIYGVGKALMAMKDTDEEAKAAWSNRMSAVREGCAAAVRGLAHDDLLTNTLTEDEATDALWSLLSVRMWEHLRIDCGWEQDRYVALMQEMAAAALLRQA